MSIHSAIFFYLSKFRFFLSLIIILSLFNGTPASASSQAPQLSTDLNTPAPAPIQGSKASSASSLDLPADFKQSLAAQGLRLSSRLAEAQIQAPQVSGDERWSWGLHLQWGERHY